jgi:hypothetical protein
LSVTAKSVFVEFTSVLTADASPSRTREWIAAIAVNKGWSESASEGQVLGEKLEKGFLVLARREYSRAVEAGRVPEFEFNSSTQEMLQGPCFVEPADDVTVREAKERRLSLADYHTALRSLTPEQFEALCRGLLALIGVSEPKVTRRSHDEGIDFFGKWDLGDQLKSLIALPGGHRLLSVWLVGQAKRYNSTDVATPDIRELVGSVTLARAKAFSRPNNPYPELPLRVCDPVFFMFATSGKMSGDSWELLKQSGVIGFDGVMIAALLADHDVARVAGAFDAPTFAAWLSGHEPTAP